MNKNLVIGLAVVVLLGGIGFWYVSQSPKSGDSMVAEVTPEPTPGPTQPAAMTGETLEVVVLGDDFKFAPNEIKVKVGTKVKVTFKNTGGFHDFVIDEFRASTAQIGNGKEETIEFVVDRAGTFEYYCSVGKHRQMGMVGKLIVE
ncbi:MAG: cupredoxin domain-containing protein [Patescibacteria group bacterium]